MNRMKCDRIFSLPFIKQIEKFKLSDTWKHRKNDFIIEVFEIPCNFDSAFYVTASHEDSEVSTAFRRVSIALLENPQKAF